MKPRQLPLALIVLALTFSSQSSLNAETGTATKLGAESAAAPQRGFFESLDTMRTRIQSRRGRRRTRPTPEPATLTLLGLGGLGLAYSRRKRQKKLEVQG